MHKSENPRDILVESKAVMDGHFVLKSGLHSSAYINKDAIYTKPRIVSVLGIDLGTPFREERVDSVVGPAIGGVILAHCVAKFFTLDRKLSAGEKDVRSLFADKDDNGGFIIRRGYDEFVTDRRVLLVEDIITSGSSVRETADAIRRVGGEVIGVSAICNRGDSTAETLGVPKLISLVEMNLGTWSADECPLCQQHVPIDTGVGHGLEFLEKRRRAK